MMIRALGADELEQHAELVYTAFETNSCDNDMLQHPDWWLRAIAADPDYTPELTRVMEIDGRLVTGVTCYRRPMTVAGREAEAVCLGSVCTHPDYRGRGLLRQVLTEAKQWMRNNGVAWCFLYGLEKVYGSSGWRPLTGWTTKWTCARPIPAPAGVTARQAAAADLGTLVELHNRFRRRHTGVVIRSRECWQRRVLSSHGPWDPAPVHRLIEGEGGPIGYVRGQGGNVGELAWVPGVASTVLEFLANECGGAPLKLPLADPETLAALTALGPPPDQAATWSMPAEISLHEKQAGLWQYLDDSHGLFPEFSDTEGLIRFLRENWFVMWPADQA